MTTANNEIYKILDTMYSNRCKIREVYQNTPVPEKIALEETVKQNVNSILKNNCSISINIDEDFSISISITNIDKVSNRIIQNVYNKIDGCLRSFITSHTFKQEVIDYVNSDLNNILDFYQVGNSLKFIL